MKGGARIGAGVNLAPILNSINFWIAMNEWWYEKCGIRW